MGCGGRTNTLEAQGQHSLAPLLALDKGQRLPLQSPEPPGVSPGALASPRESPGLWLTPSQPSQHIHHKVIIPCHRMSETKTSVALKDHLVSSSHGLPARGGPVPTTRLSARATGRDATESSWRQPQHPTQGQIGKEWAREAGKDPSLGLRQCRRWAKPACLGGGGTDLK